MKFKKCEDTEIKFDLESTHDPFVEILVSFYTPEKIVSFICKKIDKHYSAIVNLTDEFNDTIFKIEARYNSQLISLFKTKVEFEEPEQITIQSVEQPHVEPSVAQPEPSVIKIDLLKSINAEVEKAERSKEFVKSIVQLADKEKPKNQPNQDDILRFFNDLFKS